MGGGGEFAVYNDNFLAMKYILPFNGFNNSVALGDKDGVDSSSFLCKRGMEANYAFDCSTMFYFNLHFIS